MSGTNWHLGMWCLSETNKHFPLISVCLQNHTNVYPILTQSHSLTHTHTLSSRGGGLRIILMKSLSENTIVIKKSSFKSNYASYGGGVFVVYTSEVNSTNIHVSSSSFDSNNATHYGGGSNVGYTGYVDLKQDSSLTTTIDYSRSKNNSIMFENTVFSNNCGWYGGGLSIFTRNTEKALGKVIVSSSSFSQNKGSAGSAMYVGPDLLFSHDCKQHDEHDSVEINNCTFTNNYANLQNNIYFQYAVNTGAVFINKVNVVFQYGTSSFNANTNTALYVSSETRVTIGSNSHLYFLRNYGENGGALYLGHGSNIEAKNNSSLVFHKNRASFGGGLYSELPDTHSVVDNKFCFILTREDSNVTFEFTGNQATSKIGNDVFAGTFQQCCDKCHLHPENVTQLFEGSCIGQFHFNGNKVNALNIRNHISTGPHQVNISTDNSGTDEITVYSGMEVHMNVFDEVGGLIEHYYPLVTSSNNTNVMINIKPYIGNNVFIVEGSVSQSGTVLVQANHVSQQYHIRIGDCPPGRSMDNGCCECNETLYTGIHCTHKRRGAKILMGYWAGYIEGKNKSSETLLTGYCSSELCNITTDNHFGYKYLPSYRIDTVEPKLNEVVCTQGRKGVLCGRCSESNMSVHYHSSNYTCGASSACKYGPLKYIAIELLPITGLFLIILIFKISLTSGVFYGFVFYAQTISPMSYFPILSKTSKTVRFINVLEMFYNLFKLDATGTLLGSFCIVETDKIMVLLMFQYGTLLYAFLLVLGTLFIFRIHSCHKCVKLCAICGRRNITGSIVDGLSAFLVLCYAQCAQITFKLLNAVHLRGKYKQFNRLALVYDGELTFLQGEHLYFAVPAILCIIFIIIPPPVILLIEPPLTKLFSLRYFNQSCTRHYYTRLRLKLMPFLDSFQACFRDKHRYMAGLYFLYRMMVPMSYLYGSIFGPYTVVTLTLSFIIFIHILVQPYKKKWHNQLEPLIFLNLLLVMILNYATLTVDTYFTNDADTYIHNLQKWQAFFLLLPVLFLFCYAVVKVFQLVWPFIKNRCCYRWRHHLTTAGEQDSITDNSFGFPARLLSKDDGDSSFVSSTM